MLRLELATPGLALSLNLWDSERFVEAQRQIEQQGTMLGSILVLMGLTAFVAGQLMHLRVVRMLAFWLGARAAYLMSAGGYLQFWLGMSATGVRMSGCIHPSGLWCRGGRSPRFNPRAHGQPDC